MKRRLVQQCLILSLVSHATAAFAEEYKPKLRVFTSVPKAKNGLPYNKMIENKIDEMLQGEVDLTLFDKHRDGVSLYAKLSKRSEIGFRYNY